MLPLEALDEGYMDFFIPIFFFFAISHESKISKFKKFLKRIRKTV